MKHLFSIPILLVLVSFLPIYSQSFLNLEMINGADQQFQLTNMSKITFTDSSLVLDGDHLLSDIHKITFSEEVGIFTKEIDSKKKNNPISIFYNSGNLTLSLPSQMIKGSVDIMDLKGRVLKKINNTHSHNKISLNGLNLSTGIYFVRATVQNNIYTSKFNVIK